MSETQLKFAWSLHEVCMKFVWSLCEVCVKFVWSLCDVCVKYVWGLCEVCVKFVLSLREVFSFSYSHQKTDDTTVRQKSENWYLIQFVHKARHTIYVGQWFSWWEDRSLLFAPSQSLCDTVKNELRARNKQNQFTPQTNMVQTNRRAKKQLFTVRGKRYFDIKNVKLSQENRVQVLLWKDSNIPIEVTD